MVDEKVKKVRVVFVNDEGSLEFEVGDEAQDYDEFSHKIKEIIVLEK